MAGVLTSFGVAVLASGVSLSILTALEVLVALDAPPPDLLNDAGLPVGVQASCCAVHGQDWLNHFLAALANA